MVTVDYQKKYHQKIIRACVAALKAGKVLAYPTDTSYGLAVDANNIGAIKKLYRIKGRDFNKPVHVVVPSVAYAKKIAKWDNQSSRLTKKFWPGPLTLVLPLRINNKGLTILCAKTGLVGLRMPKNQIALDLAKNLGRPITATSANISGKKDCYSAKDITDQFRNKKFQPDIIINAGALPRRRPSTVLKIGGNSMQILRIGPVTKRNIAEVLK